MARAEGRAETIGDLLRYALALSGPIGSAGAQFLLSLVLLRQLDPAPFGRFSFLLIVAQLSAGIWSALFCAPLPLVLGDTHRAGDPARTMLSASLIGAGIALPVFFALALAVDEGWSAAALFATYAAFALLRWFARALGYARAAQARVSGSDAVYSAALLIGTAVLVASGVRGTGMAYAVFLLATFAALVAFGRGFAIEVRAALRTPALGDYRAIWRAHGRWSLLGVLTSEATGNAHAYLVTVFLGAAAFAPIAAAAILIRPITVVSNALTEFERARIARAIATGELARVRRALRLFRAIMLMSWIATAIASIVLLWNDPRLIFPATYPRKTLALGVALWMATALIRVWRTPEGTLLQAGDAFRPLAMTSVWSAGLSILAVTVLLVSAPPLWSLLGIAFGDAVCAALIFRAARAWYGRRAAQPLSVSI